MSDQYYSAINKMVFAFPYYIQLQKPNEKDINIIVPSNLRTYAICFIIV